MSDGGGDGDRGEGMEQGFEDLVFGGPCAGPEIGYADRRAENCGIGKAEIQLAGENYGILGPRNLDQDIGVDQNDHGLRRVRRLPRRSWRTIAVESGWFRALARMPMNACIACARPARGVK